jgi:hypothetical protein
MKRQVEGTAEPKTFVYFCDHHAGCDVKALGGNLDGWTKAGADEIRGGKATTSFRYHFCPLHADDARAFGGPNGTYSPMVKP